ncbi:MAG: DNA double-strand break repair nuclease NurA [Candidatus Nanohaloarchaea archaeon]
MASLGEAADKLSEREDRLESIRKKFEDVDSIEMGQAVKEQFLSKKVGAAEAGTVAGVDGGLLKKRYSSGDIVATRAIAAIFDFTGETMEASYYPSRSPEPDFTVYDAHESDSLDRNAESQRLRDETSAVLGVLDETDRVFMDGSVVPSYLDDNSVLENYEKLFDKAEDGQVAGVVEDSYGLKLASILQEKLGIEIGKIRDTLLMDVILEEGERSFVRKYSASPVEHPVLQELEDRHVNRLFTFYVKLSSEDLPIRVDYFGTPEDADDIAGVMMKLMASRRYTAPSPVVEADKRAKIPREYVKRLEKKFSPGLMRRERRMF